VHSDAKYAIRSASNTINHKQQAHYQLNHSHIHVRESGLGHLTPTQMWLRVTAREAPWQMIEVATEVLGAKTEDPFGPNYNTGFPEAGVIYGGSICSDGCTRI
jgi:hypothetical protein